MNLCMSYFMNLHHESNLEHFNFKIISGLLLKSVQSQCYKINLEHFKLVTIFWCSFSWLSSVTLINLKRTSTLNEQRYQIASHFWWNQFGNISNFQTIAEFFVELHCPISISSPWLRWWWIWVSLWCS